jgi:hypothetical protein
MKEIVLNEGSQKDFVNTDERYAAYIGGLGSGKTFAGIVRGLKFSQQPKPPGTNIGPRGVCAAINYPVLMDVVLPEFWEITEGTGLVKQYIKSEKKAILRNGAEILFRSLDQPDKMRGLKLAWFFIDEGRHVTRKAWDILVGRLRQPGYAHGGWVCSTPNGYDWMWELFNEESPFHLDSAQWFGASTFANRDHLPAEYIDDLQVSYSGKWYEQEVLGKFVGLMSGAVFPEWDPVEYSRPLAYDPSLPLYSFWDFGVGDLGVCTFAQIEHKEEQTPTGVKYIPYLYILDTIEAQDWGAAEWAQAWHKWLDDNAGGRRPTSSWGDPAGRQRSQATGTSVIDALRAHSVPVNPAPKKAPDYGILILRNMMAGGRVFVDKEKGARMGAALSTHKWSTDDQGNRIGNQPVHDWTSHFASTLRYGAASLLSHFPKRASKPVEEAPPYSMKHIEDQILRPDPGNWLGPKRSGKIDWMPVGQIGVPNGN